MSARNVLLVASVVMTGLMGGLFFAWMVSVIPGLKRVADHTYISTMQSINVAIVNPAFVIPYMLTPVLLAASSVAEFRAGSDRRALLLAIASVTYVIGVLGVTAGGNIPLNNTLDAFDLSTSTDADSNAQRTAYESAWNRWHALRTGASVAAFAVATASTLTLQENE